MKEYKAIRGKRIGKIMRDYVYIHKSAINSLTKKELDLYNHKLSIIRESGINFSFDVIKISIVKEEVSFIESKDWDIENEPSVGDSYKVKKDDSIVFTKSKNLIYHHKWMFVSDDYKGFDTNKSKTRSETWMNHPKVLELKKDTSEKFNSKIGRRDYWNQKVCSLIRK